MYAFSGLGAIVAILFAAIPQLTTAPKATIEYSPEPPYSQQKFLDALIRCESGGNPNAINPKDRDGTPSLGVLQFKPSTLYYFAHVKYKILPDIEEEEIMNLIFDPDLQIRVAKLMILDPQVDLSRQFPDCYRRYHSLLRASKSL